MCLKKTLKTFKFNSFCFILIPSKLLSFFYQIWWNRHGGHPGSSSPFPQRRVEQTIPDDERIWICIWQLHSRPSFRSTHLAIHTRLSDSSQVYWWDSFKFLQWICKHLPLIFKKSSINHSKLILPSPLKFL